jgi:arylsulfatase A
MLRIRLGALGPLLLGLLIAIVAPAGLAAAEPSPRLNVVLIVADDLGQRDLGCYGSTFYKTSNIDKSGERWGLKFSDYYRRVSRSAPQPGRAFLPGCTRPGSISPTGSPVGPTDPTRSSNDPSSESTTAAGGGHPFRVSSSSAGYSDRPLIGKWHLGGEGFGPEQARASTSISRGDETGTARSYFAPFPQQGQGVMPGLETAPEGEYLTDRLTTEAEKFLEANKDHPFFLNLSSLRSRTRR